MDPGEQMINTTGSEMDTPLAGKPFNQWNPEELDGCIASSERLLGILKAEGEALRKFQNERLLELIAEKELLACELAHRVKTFQSLSSLLRKSRQDPLQLGATDRGDTEEAREGQREKLGLLRYILDEITKHNQRNRLFVQGSLRHWEDLLSLCLPGTYATRHDGQAIRQSFRAKGLSLNKEI